MLCGRERAGRTPPRGQHGCLDHPKRRNYLINMNDRSTMPSFWEREQSYRRRLLVSVPISAAIVFFLFLTSDQVSLSEIDKRVGLEGYMQVLPEITVLSDNDPYRSEERERMLETMTTVDIDLLEHPDISKPRLVNVERPKETEILDFAEHDIYQVRTKASRVRSSYSDKYVLLKMVEPIYPVRELNEGIEGTVTVELLVNEEGLVESATVLSLVGPVSFRESSLEAVRQFVFRPPTENGKPIAMWVKFLIKFRIFG